MNKIEKFVKLKARGFSNRYLISNFGTVKSIKTGLALKPYKAYKFSDRLYIYLCKNGKMKNFSISRLVLKHFKRYPNQKEISAFLDANETNNYIKNLAWMTRGNWMRYKRSIKGEIKGVFKFKIKDKNGNIKYEKWRSVFKVNGKIKTFGYFKTKEDAIACTYSNFIRIYGHEPW